MLPHTAKWENYNGEKQTEGKKRAEGRDCRRGWRLRDRKRDSMRWNSLHTAHPNIHNLSLPLSPVFVPLSVICCKGTLCEFQWDPASLLPGCCVDSWTDKSVSAPLCILPISLSNSRKEPNHVTVRARDTAVRNSTSILPPLLTLFEPNTWSDCYFSLFKHDFDHCFTVFYKGKAQRHLAYTVSSIRYVFEKHQDFHTCLQY